MKLTHRKRARKSRFRGVPSYVSPGCLIDNPLQHGALQLSVRKGDVILWLSLKLSFFFLKKKFNQHVLVLLVRDDASYLGFPLSLLFDLGRTVQQPQTVAYQPSDHKKAQQISPLPDIHCLCAVKLLKQNRWEEDTYIHTYTLLGDTSTCTSSQLDEVGISLGCKGKE